MKKYGYKNISTMDDFDKSTRNGGKHEPNMTQEKHYGNNGMVDWSKQGTWGVPGQTQYKLKTIEELLKANEISTGTIISKLYK